MALGSGDVDPSKLDEYSQLLLGLGTRRGLAAVVLLHFFTLL